MRLALPLFVSLATLLAGCDLLGIEGASAVAGKREAEGKAVGGACRHAGRALEDCYALNKKADKGAIFAGWREMNDYMRENKIDEVPPQMATTAPTTAKAGAKSDADDEESAEDEKPAQARKTKGG